MEKTVKNTKYPVDGYIGTYHSENSRGIYHFTFDPESGCLTAPELYYEARNAKWVCTDGGSYMIFPIEQQGKAGTCFLTLRGGKVVRQAEILNEQQTPCYILKDGDFVFTANYHEGNVMVYHTGEAAPVLIKRIENGSRAGCHQILLHGSWLLVPCLEQNRIRLFDTANGFAPAGEIPFPPGAGPRHGVFNRAHTKLYMVSEWSNQLFLFQVHGYEFTLVQCMSVLPDIGNCQDAAAAAVRLAEDERFLYISIRGIDCLCVVDVSGDYGTVIQHTSCGGVHPRDIVLSQDEKFLLAANRYGGGIVSMERDQNSGLLGRPQYSVPMPECVALILIQARNG